MNKTVAAFLLLLLAPAGCAFHDRQQPPLELTALLSDREGPQPAHAAAITWTAVADGGVGELSYEFKARIRGLEVSEQQGGSPHWEWRPDRPGEYHLKVIVRDAAGRQADSGWSPPYRITPPVDKSSRLTLLPVENLSGSPAPVDLIGRVLQETLAREGLSLLPEAALADFMRKLRIRYTGGVGTHTARSLLEEAGVEAVLITSLEAYQESAPPQISLIARLVLTGDQPAVLWMDSIGLTGDDKVGLLDLGKIRDHRLLLDRAAALLAESLTAYLTGDLSAPAEPSGNEAASGLQAASGPETREKGIKRRYRPRSFFRSLSISDDKRYRIAVIPFLNQSDRKNAGTILGLHFVRQLLEHPLLTVIEPGLVREELLRFRAVMEAGPSLALADLITGPSSLGTELVLSGKVFDYQSTGPVPKVDFSTQILEGDSRKIVSNSRSFNQGDEGVYFFDFGRVHTAQELTREMARAVLGSLFP